MSQSSTRKAELLPNRPGQEALDAMNVPAGGFHQAFQRCSALLLEQLQHLGGFIAVAGTAEMYGPFTNEELVGDALAVR